MPLSLNLAHTLEAESLLPHNLGTKGFECRETSCFPNLICLGLFLEIE